eukprot:5631149-Pleurochrysis_carterae.AAC.2
MERCDRTLLRSITLAPFHIYYMIELWSIRTDHMLSYLPVPGKARMQSVSGPCSVEVAQVAVPQNN